jgi:hypothetical protein
MIVVSDTSPLRYLRMNRTTETIIRDMLQRDYERKQAQKLDSKHEQK